MNRDTKLNIGKTYNTNLDEILQNQERSNK